MGVTLAWLFGIDKGLCKIHVIEQSHAKKNSSMWVYRLKPRNTNTPNAFIFVDKQNTTLKIVFIVFFRTHNQSVCHNLWHHNLDSMKNYWKREIWKQLQKLFQRSELSDSLSMLTQMLKTFMPNSFTNQRHWRGS